MSAGLLIKNKQNDLLGEYDANDELKAHRMFARS